MINKQKAIQDLIQLGPKTQEELNLVKRKIAKKYKIGILLNSDILKDTDCNLHLRKLLRKRAIRTLSGIAPVAVLIKPYSCPGKCAYCPTEKDVPQSYLSNEPAVMRAIRCNYNPYVQVQARIKALEDNGHEPTKIELIVIGGTWSVLPKKYKYWYVANLFAAANDYPSVIPSRRRRIPRSFTTFRMTEIKKKLAREQKKNEKAKYKIIGLTLETRPDYISELELLEMRELGATRVELGVQAVDDKILKLNKRGHGVKKITEATRHLKDFGFKVTYHIMPGLPGSSAKKDLAMFKKLFSDERFQPDQIKLYPTVVTKGSLLYKWWKAGKYKPYSDKVLQKLIIDCKKVVPSYVRIIRLIRDIPGESIEAGNLITNLRQVMKDKGVKCKCIRCREAREKKLEVRSKKLEIIQYKASGGEEYFLEYTDKSKKVLYGFCRLRLPCHCEERSDEAISDDKKRKRLPRSFQSLAMTNFAIIRELHVYGELVSIGSKKRTQHAGLGKKLLKEAEKIARENGHKKLYIISGVGVRDYYRKFGYRQENTYMVKIL